mgnify:CR=1 FL=1
MDKKADEDGMWRGGAVMKGGGCKATRCSTAAGQSARSPKEVVTDTCGGRVVFDLVRWTVSGNDPVKASADVRLAPWVLQLTLLGNASSWATK